MIACIKNFYARSYLIPPNPFEEEDKSNDRMGKKGITMNIPGHKKVIPVFQVIPIGRKTQLFTTYPNYR